MALAAKRKSKLIAYPLASEGNTANLMLPDTGVTEKVVGIDQAVANIIPTGSMIVPSNSDIPIAAACRSSRSSDLCETQEAVSWS